MVQDMKLELCQSIHSFTLSLSLKHKNTKALQSESVYVASHCKMAHSNLLALPPLTPPPPHPLPPLSLPDVRLLRLRRQGRRLLIGVQHVSVARALQSSLSGL